MSSATTNLYWLPEAQHLRKNEKFSFSRYFANPCHCLAIACSCTNAWYSMGSRLLCSRGFGDALAHIREQRRKLRRPNQEYHNILAVGRTRTRRQMAKRQQHNFTLYQPIHPS